MTISSGSQTPHFRTQPGRGSLTLPQPNPCQEGIISVQAISWVLDHSESRLGARHVLISIANHAQSDGTGSWPSIATIGRESKLSEREVRYALRELEELEELKTEVSAGPRGCNMYSLPKMRGAKFAGGKIKQEMGGEGGKILPGGGQPSAPEPSLTVTEIRPLVTENFLVFWEAYPNKVLQPAAFRAWARHGLEVRLGEVLVSLEAWKKTPKWDDKQFIPYPEKWLNDGYWKEVPKEQRNGKAGQGNARESFNDQRSRKSAHAIDSVLGRLAKTSGNLHRALPPADK